MKLLLAGLLQVNVALGLFNLIPVPPLDGSRVLGGVLPNTMRAGYSQLERFAPAFLMILFYSAGSLLDGPMQVVIDLYVAGASFVFP